MLYLFWALLNLALVISFIAICFKATKLIRERIGLPASVIFVFGLLSFMGNPGTDNGNTKPNSNQIKTWKFASEDSLHDWDTYVVNVDIEKTLISKYTLGIKYGKDKKGKLNIPISANSSTSGFIFGTNWKPGSIIVNRTNDNNKFTYSVNGVIEWKLFGGATIYTQRKNYEGTVEVE